MGLDVSAVTLPLGLSGPRVPGCRPSCASSVWKGNLEEFGLFSEYPDSQGPRGLLLSLGSGMRCQVVSKCTNLSSC